VEDPRETIANTSIQEKQLREILQWLSTIEHVKHHDNNKEGLLEDTGNWLLTGERFSDWEKSTTSSFLWLRGDREFTENLFLGTWVLTLYRSWRGEDEAYVGVLHLTVHTCWFSN